MIYNGITYKNNYAIVSKLDKHFLVDFKQAEKKYKDEHPITDKEIEEEAIVRGIDLKKYPEKRDEIKEDLLRDVNNRAEWTCYKVAEETWESPTPIPDRWYIVYTSWARFQLTTYSKHRGWDIQLGHDCTPETIISWTPVEIIQTAGKEVGGIHYVGFYDWRFKDDEVVIYPLDKLKFRLNSNKVSSVVFGQSTDMTMMCAEKKYHITKDEILEIELVEADSNDEKYIEYQKQQEEERKIKEEEERIRREERIKKEEKIKEEKRKKAEKEAEERRKREEEIRKQAEFDAFTYDLLYNPKTFLDNISKDDLKQIKKRLESKLVECRASGRTTRIVNQIVEDFYQEPMGTEIPIRDHYYESNGRMDSFIVDLVKDRLRHWPGKQIYKSNKTGDICIRRTKRTNYETIVEKLNTLNEFLE